MLEEDSKTWAFALGVYGQGGVKDAALRLQDDFDADAVLVLFFAWLGLGGCHAIPAQVVALLAMSREWQGSVIGPLRRQRRQLKTIEGRAAREVYAALKGSELEFERMELWNLEDAVAKGGFVFDLAAGSKDMAMANLEIYFENTGAASPWAAVRDSVELIVDQAAEWSAGNAGK